ncbi:heterokaryon incompatibility protein-domain-containing protein [Chaetomium fimeti]|uniref:Heterokaryon incompatibility protein-domain-containing protein n=1 Tax=Chaetomium fimeti TaxID=1854472 RepID=A0AAE0LVZ2_9PEZI|nr:heterokaryon incompatibility protein-domain-containing protein [Chaetomium fimeti]
MALCEICKRVDFRSLLVACIQQWQAGRAEAEDMTDNGDGYDVPSTLSGSSCINKHHSDVFEVGKCAPECHLCQIIFQAFERRGVKDPEDARGLPIILRAFNNKIQVCFSSGEEPIELCTLDLCVDDASVTEVFRTLDKDDDPPPILYKVNTDPGSESSLATASSWLQNCLRNHNLCQPPLEFHHPPKRLINVGNTTQHPFLVEMGPNSPPVKWLCLSYCWGGFEPAVKLTRANMNKLKSGMLSGGESLDSLDATVRDAILVARALDIPYIWIDALCILQDKDANEWNEQAPKMNEIYGGSVLTLVAASAKTVKDGFLTKRRLQQYVPISASDTPSGDAARDDPRANVFLSPEWPAQEDLANGPWNSRGWTMQEGLLPNRLLYYTSSQMMWKCKNEQRFERGVTKSLDHVLKNFDDRVHDPEYIWLETSDTFSKFKRFPYCLPAKWVKVEPEMFRLWYDLVENYSPRQFTNPGDRLVAVSGLAKVFGDAIRSEDYFAGLWKSDMIRGLMWYIEGATLIPRSPLDNDVFPTWSWASAGCGLVNHDHKDWNIPLSRVENAQVDLVDKRQPFGPLKTGSANTITLTGRLKRLPRLYNKAWECEDASMSALERHLSEMVERESPGKVELRYSSPSGVHFAALQMLRDHESLGLLVLESTREAPNNVYRRVGVVTLRGRDERNVCSPDLLAKIMMWENSLDTRLGPREWAGKEDEFHDKVLVEVMEETWKEESVVII